MRIGTWNVNNRVMTNKHRELLLEQECDVWLITEMNRKWADDEGTSVLHFHSHLSKGVMSRHQHWAAVLSVMPLVPLEDPHAASAAAMIGEVTFCCTVLPWRGVKAASEPWIGLTHSEMTQQAITTLLSCLPRRNLVWGGDWNHSLIGKEFAGSHDGREYVLEAIACLGLKVPTANLQHLTNRFQAIEHIGVPLS